MSNNKFKVLIVEDEANICSFIETLLTTNDYQALVAHTCTMGLTLFASHNPGHSGSGPAGPGRAGIHPHRAAEVYDPHRGALGPHRRDG